MHTYIYTYIHLHIYTLKHVHIHIYVYIYIYTYCSGSIAAFHRTPAAAARISARVLLTQTRNNESDAGTARPAIHKYTIILYYIILYYVILQYMI